MLQTTTRTSANVLIVEDEFLVALQLEDILTDAGHKVVGIVPDQASAHALDEWPEVALVDLNLRDGPSGLTIAQQLAERYGTVIVYVTANPAQIGTPAPTALGVVQKPFSHHAILAAVSMALNGEAENVPPELNLCFRAAS
ncbi:response regulator [Novosphingobium sp. PS1R-30]|uniref:Response regulator n=1 Tax=Novosphingobium anseongense TaxID=3133436 RepID=A0ABU8RYA4_9SPHN|nr:MAG: response regulator [Novosphingobium sp.]